MTGHVDDAHHAGVRQIEPREAQFDSHSPRFFRVQTVWIDSRQFLNECGLAVIYVTSCSNDKHVVCEL